MQRRRLSRIEQEFVVARAFRRCEYCQYPFDFSHDAFHIEHIIPLSKGGMHQLDNVAYACDGCNSYKWAHTAWNDDNGNLTPIFHPRMDNWNEHFAWSDDFSLIIPLTPKGAATVTLLQMNRSGLVNVRKALHAYGVHPAQTGLGK